MQRVKIETACIIHPNAPTDKGYVWLQGPKKYAHVIALEEKLGRPIKAGFVAMHLCDTKNCINQEHLMEGTQSDNISYSYADSNTRRRGPDRFQQVYCKRGHIISQVSVNRRRCRVCAKLQMREQRARLKA